MECDRNDNTQELQLNLRRGDAEDLLFGAATGHHLRHAQARAGRVRRRSTGPPRRHRAASGASRRRRGATSPFTVTNNPNNRR